MTQALEASFKQQNPKNRFELDCFNAGFTFEALLIAADAFKRAGTSDSATLMKAVKETNIKDHVMIGGPIAFNDKGDNLNIASASIENIKQTPTVVFPADVATAKPVLPCPRGGAGSRPHAPPVPSPARCARGEDGRHDMNPRHSRAADLLLLPLSG